MGHYRMIPDKSVEILLGELSRDIAQRTPGTGDFPTAVEGLELFRRNEPAPPGKLPGPSQYRSGGRWREDHVGWG